MNAYVHCVGVSGSFWLVGSLLIQEGFEGHTGLAHVHLPPLGFRIKVEMGSTAPISRRSPDSQGSGVNLQCSANPL